MRRSRDVLHSYHFIEIGFQRLIWRATRNVPSSVKYFRRFHWSIRRFSPFGSSSFNAATRTMYYRCLIWKDHMSVSIAKNMFQNICFYI